MNGQEFDLSPMYPTEGIRAYDPRRDTAFGFQPTREFYSDVESLWNTLRGVAEIGGTVLPLLGMMPGTPNPKGLPLTQVMKGGKPTRVYHGTPKAYQAMDPERGKKGSLFGPSPGGYWTENPKTAAGYSMGRERYHPINFEANLAAIPKWREQAQVWSEEYRKTGNPKFLQLAREAQSQVDRLRHITQNVSQPNIRVAYLNITDPLDMDGPVPAKWVEAVKRWYDTTFPQHSEEIPRKLDEAVRDKQTARVLYDWLKRWGFSESGVRKTIKDAGYDGITHVGQSGARQWIPFSKDQIVDAFSYEAQQYKRRLEQTQHRD